MEEIPLKIGLVYLIREEMYVRMKKPYYKIGQTNDLPGRIKAYGQESEIVCVQKVRNYQYAEKILKEEFNKFFHLVEGLETFEGDLGAMYLLFVRAMSPLLYPKTETKLFDSMIINESRSEILDKIEQNVEKIASSNSVCAGCGKKYISERGVMKHLQRGKCKNNIKKSI